MARFECPECRDPLSTSGLCKTCGYRLKAATSSSAKPGHAAHHLAEPPAPYRPTEEDRTKAQPHIDRCKALAAALAKRKTPRGEMPRVGMLAALALKGIDLDPEAEAERRALQDGL